MSVSNRVKGVLTSWNDEKGFGFITPNKGNQQVFIHIKSIGNRQKRPEKGQCVSYILATDKLGRVCAEKCILSGARFLNITSFLIRSIPILSSVSFFAVVALAVYMTKIPPFILVFYILFSLVTFIMYAVDKSAARKGNWRTKETSLHLFSLVGGWPGALLAQKIVRHKNHKKSFLTIFWITVFINAGVFVWLITPNGAETLQTIIQGIVWGLTAGTS